MIDPSSKCIHVYISTIRWPGGQWMGAGAVTPESIATALRGELMAGVLRPGAELSQVDLADRFGVSRIPVRDALRILAGEGLVEIELNRGAKAISLTPDQVRE